MAGRGRIERGIRPARLFAATGPVLVDRAPSAEIMAVAPVLAVNALAPCDPAGRGALPT